MPRRRREEKMDEEEVEVEEEETAAGDVVLIEETRELKSCARPVRPPAHAESVGAAMVAVDRGDLTKRAEESPGEACN